jgi:hypothetical protein
MKTMTCKDSGGASNEKLSVETWDDMAKLHDEHISDKRSDVGRSRVIQAHY